jgi:hypothetical protein
LTDGTERPFDQTIVAVPWHKLSALLPPHVLEAVDPKGAIAAIESASIASVHLWFDRPLTDLPHAVFVGRLSQWLFARDLGGERGEHYYQVVISGAHFLAGAERRSIVEEVVHDLVSIFPDAAAARLLRSKLIIDSSAVFSVRPGIDQVRPPARTPIAGLLLAGDWTRTGWPATMEGAVRSGYLAAEAALSQLGRPDDVVAPDLPQSWLMKELIGRS